MFRAKRLKLLLTVLGCLPLLTACTGKLGTRAGSVWFTVGNAVDDVTFPYCKGGLRAEVSSSGIMLLKSDLFKPGHSDSRVRDAKAERVFRGVSKGSNLRIEAWCFDMNATQEAYYLYEGNLTIELEQTVSWMMITTKDEMEISSGSSRGTVEIICPSATLLEGIDAISVCTNWVSTSLTTVAR